MLLYPGQTEGENVSLRGAGPVAPHLVWQCGREVPSRSGSLPGSETQPVTRRRGPMKLAPCALPLLRYLTGSEPYALGLLATELRH